MKKILLFTNLAIIATLFVPSITHTNEAKAQLVTTLTPIAANDTLTNADTADVYITTSSTASKTFSSTASIADNISRSVELKLTRLSGTAAGSLTLSGSIDGTNWITISTDTLVNQATNVQVYALRASNGDLLYRYYKCTFITSGTVSAIPQVNYLRRSN